MVSECILQSKKSIHWVEKTTLRGKVFRLMAGQVHPGRASHTRTGWQVIGTGD